MLYLKHFAKNINCKSSVKEELLSTKIDEVYFIL